MAQTGQSSDRGNKRSIEEDVKEEDVKEEEDDEWIGPMPAEAVKPKKKKGKLSYVCKIGFAALLLALSSAAAASAMPRLPAAASSTQPGPGTARQTNWHCTAHALNCWR